ncbi:MAG: protein-glutamate O-methyltransferase CheR [Magnetococcales bacterium]|nr:protein-glutamate O-methyltransferase CheR [Magnetococcales bacterium]
MEADSLDRFQSTLIRHTGLVIPELDHPQLAELLKKRVRALRMPSHRDYLALLENDSSKSRDEWRHLSHTLTIGESYFFRDNGQMTLLRETILPDLIKNNRHRGQLRIWSAGCSTGEEPYSLAMILHRIEHLIPDWQVMILGTDINETALAKAQKGIYSRWAMRQLDDAQKALYFKKDKRGFKLSQLIRDRVRFKPINLIKTPFPSIEGDLHDMDLILCRNVLIYFSQETGHRLARKFAETLRSGGYLLTSHAELSAPYPPGLNVRIMPESIIFQKLDGDDPKHKPTSPRPPTSTAPLLAQLDANAAARPSTIPAHTTPLPTHPPSAAQPHRWQADVKRLQEAFMTKRYKEALALAEQMLTQDTVDQQRFEILFLTARIHANRGAYRLAAELCDRLTALDRFSERPHLLLAHLLEAQESATPEADALQIRHHLQKALYLNPDSIAALLEMSALHRRLGEPHRARRLQKAAQSLLMQWPHQEAPEFLEDWSLAGLKEELSRTLESS